MDLTCKMHLDKMAQLKNLDSFLRTKFDQKGRQILCPHDLCIQVLTVEVLEVVLLGPQVVLDDEGIGAGEIRHGAGIELATQNWKNRYC